MVHLQPLENIQTQDISSASNNPIVFYFISIHYLSTDFVVHVLHGETHNSPVSFDVILECDSSADANHVVLGLLQQRE